MRKRIVLAKVLKASNKRYNEREIAMIEGINKQFVKEFGIEGIDLP